MIRAPRHRVGVGALALALGAVLLIAGVARVERPAPRALPQAFGTLGSSTSASTSTSAAQAARPSAESATGSPMAAPDVDEPAAPTQLRAPSLGVRARVVPVGSTRDAIDVPTAVSTVGWWDVGATPDSPVGTTVIVGHVDSAADGPGALFRLDELHRGDVLEIVTAHTLMWRYRVTALRVVPKSTGLAGLHLAAATSPRLAVITCGGAFDSRTRSYADNIVVLAAPVG